MNLGLSAVYGLMQKFSRMAVVATIVSFALLSLLGIHISISIQISIALLALLLGVPHGAVDHLISISTSSKVRFAIFILLYILLALMAGYAIARWNLLGFQLVLLMSSLHFGFGDAAFEGEWRATLGLSRHGFLLECIYALPAGALPVILPLTESRSVSALNRIHRSLNGWAGSLQSGLRVGTILLALLAIVVLFIAKNRGAALDLALLLLLSLIAPPLITFAIYFGCWHAARHTARLVPKLPKALTSATDGESARAIWAAVWPGLYAVVGTIVVGVVLMVALPDRFGSGMLWATLVVVWALTVPHMVATARFDVKAL